MTTFGRLTVSLLLLTVFSTHPVTALDLADVYDADKCGYSDVVRSKRAFDDDDDDDALRHKVMGGEDAEKGELPWAVALQYAYKDGTTSAFCSGTLVSRRHVITAAHCFMADQRPEQGMQNMRQAVRTIIVKMGGVCLTAQEPDLNGDGGCDESDVMYGVRVKSVTLGNFFSGMQRIGYDIAVIELVDNVNVTHACLPQFHNMDYVDVLNNGKLTAAGYGSDALNQLDNHNRLQKLVYGNAIEKRKCGQMLRRSDMVSTDFICTKEESERNVCRGDSGGGLVAFDGDKRAILVGVVSYGGGCEMLAERKIAARAQMFTDIRYHSGLVATALGVYQPFHRL